MSGSNDSLLRMPVSPYPQMKRKYSGLQGTGFEPYFERTKSNSNLYT